MAEVDLKASQLTLLLGITGHREAPNDAYDFPGIPRDVVKAWVVQTLGSGAPVRTWNKNVDVDVWRVKPRVIREAVLARYGFLADLPGLVPAEAFDGIPARKRGVAAGQWVAQREAAILARTMLALVSAAVPVLPVHDAVIVPVGEAERASAALADAFVDLAGIRPRVKVTRPAGAFAAPAQEAA